MKKWLIVLLTALLVLVAGTALANTMDTAVPISLNTEYTDNIASTSEEDWYRFSLPEDGVVYLTFRHEFVDSSADLWNLKIMDIQREVFLSEEFKGNELNTVETCRLGLPAGTYYLKANDTSEYPFSCHSDVNYTFSLRFTASPYWEKEHNDDIPEANPIALNTDYSGSICMEGGEDYYAITLPEDGVITLTFSHVFHSSSAWFWQADLMNLQRDHYLDQSYKGNEEGKYTSFEIGLPAGTYYLRIADCYDYRPRAHDSGTYVFRVNYTASSVWEKEFNNEMENATPITLNTTWYGAEKNFGDNDWYQFTLPEDGYVTLTFGHGFEKTSSICWTAEIYNLQEQEYFHESYVGNEEKELTSYSLGLPAGTFYLLINDCDHSSEQTYHFSVNYTESSVWETELNNDMDSADEISLNTTWYGAMRKYGDNDWYTFTLPEDGYISVTFGHGFADTSYSCWEMQLYNRQEEKYLYEYYKGNEKKEITSGKLGLPAGTYYLFINDCDHSSTETYRFSVNFTEASEWETELNNEKDTADEVSLNTAWYGAICNDGDDDWYTFTLPEDGYITVSFGHGFVDSSGTYWQMALYNGLKEKYLEEYYAGNEKKEVTTFKLGLARGTYYLWIGDSQGSNRTSSETYHFSVNFKESSTWESEFNDSREDANLITPGTGYTGTSYGKLDDDWFRFSLKEKGRMFIRFRRTNLKDKNPYWVVKLQDETQNEYLKQTVNGDTAVTDTQTIELDAGTYYLAVSASGSGRYSTVPYTVTVCSEIVREAGLNFALSGKEAVFIGPEDRKTDKITIPDQIKVYGSTYKVTEIEAGACRSLTGLKELSIGKYVQKIGKEAFLKCSGLKTVTGGAGVRTIGASAFRSCKALKKYDLGKKTVTILSSAFAYCSKLESVTGGTALEKIDTSAFMNCSSLKAFTFQSKVKSIGRNTFKNCGRLVSLVFKTTKLKDTTIGANAFGKTGTPMTVTCPKSKLSSYKKILLKRGLNKKKTVFR